MRILIEGLGQRLSNLRPLMQRIGQFMVSSTQRKIMEGIPPENAPLTRRFKKGSGTLRDTGRLLSSITYRLRGDDAVEVGTSLRYARIHQEGGTIRPKAAKKLAIPASWQTRRLMRRHGQSVRAVLDALKGQGWSIWFTDGAIMGKKGKKGRAQVLFVRKSSVDIPRRRFLFVDQRDEGVIRRMVEGYLLGRS